ncbi:hypothetical protein Vretifemale_15442, partial [Volvox reticuliferus]
QVSAQPWTQAAAQDGAGDVVVFGMAAAAPTSPESALVVVAATTRSTAAAPVLGSTRRVSVWGRAMAQLHDLHRVVFRRTSTSRETEGLTEGISAGARSGLPASLSPPLVPNPELSAPRDLRPHRVVLGGVAYSGV